jgi:hypothetical protein
LNTVHFALIRAGLPALAICGAIAACDSNDAAPPLPTVDGGSGSSTPVDASTPARDSGSSTPDSGTADSTPTDAAPDVTAASMCTGGAPLPIFGNYVAGDGALHWLRRSASAETYSRVPAGAPSNATPPTLWLITQVCSDQNVFVAMSETSTYARVDWARSSSEVQLCIAVEGATNAAAALAAPASVPDSATGCNGGAWTVLSRTDGGQ